MFPGSFEKPQPALAAPPERLAIEASPAQALSVHAINQAAQDMRNIIEQTTNADDLLPRIADLEARLIAEPYGGLIDWTKNHHPDTTRPIFQLLREDDNDRKLPPLPAEDTDAYISDKISWIKGRLNDLAASDERLGLPWSERDQLSIDLESNDASTHAHTTQQYQKALSDCYDMLQDNRQLEQHMPADRLLARAQEYQLAQNNLDTAKNQASRLREQQPAASSPASEAPSPDDDTADTATAEMPPFLDNVMQEKTGWEDKRPSWKRLCDLGRVSTLWYAAGAKFSRTKWGLAEKRREHYEKLSPDKRRIWRSVDLLTLTTAGVMVGKIVSSLMAARHGMHVDHDAVPMPSHSAVGAPHDALPSPSAEPVAPMPHSQSPTPEVSPSPSHSSATPSPSPNHSLAPEHLPGAAPNPDTVPPEATTTQTVQPGDSLWKIAQNMYQAQYHQAPTDSQTTSIVNNLADANHLPDPNQIDAGQTLNTTSAHHLIDSLNQSNVPSGNSNVPAPDTSHHHIPQSHNEQPLLSTDASHGQVRAGEGWYEWLSDNGIADRAQQQDLLTHTHDQLIASGAAYEQNGQLYMNMPPSGQLPRAIIEMLNRTLETTDD